MSLFNEFRKKKEQKENADAGRQRVMHEMKMKSAMQGRKIIEAHCMETIKTIVPAWCRMVADNVLFKIYFKFLGTLMWLIHQPSRLVCFLIKVFLIAPVLWIRRKMWSFGCWTEMDKIDEWRIRVKIHRWFKLKYACTIDWRSGNKSEVIRDRKL